MAYKDGSRLQGGRAYRQSQGFKEHIRRRDNYTCQYCGEYGYIIDHIIPFSISGETKPAGVQISCHKCNLARRLARRDSNLPLEKWYAALESQLSA